MDQLRPYRGLLAILLVITLVTIGLTVLVPRYVLPWLAGLESAQKIAVAAVIISSVIATKHVVDYRRTSRGKVVPHLSIAVTDHRAVITSTITNIGGKCLTPRTADIFIDQGIQEEAYYDFPHLLAHQGEDDDCELCRYCKTKGKQGFPSDLVDARYKAAYRERRSLMHITEGSIQRVYPGEEFAEDVILRLPGPGAYRVIFIFTCDGAECVCASKEFLIPEEVKASDA
jgi:hypothetical protein